MKRIISMISILFIIAGCKKPEVCAYCGDFTFEQTYLKHVQYNEIFLIKGVALDVIQHGRAIKVVEDLKGNFDDKPAILVWGASSISFCDDKGRQDLRVDYITQYHKNDTLIMLIKNAYSRFFMDIEKPGTYATLGGCQLSVLQFSNDSVSGPITSYWRQTLSWEDFQKLLNSNKP